MTTEYIRSLEKTARLLEENSSQRSTWVQQAHAYAEAFLTENPHRPMFYEFAGNPPDAQAFQVTEEPTEMADLIARLDAQVDRPGLNPAGPGHFGYVPGGGIFPAAIGDYLAAVFNKYAGVYYPGPGAVTLENTLIRWMCGLVGFPDSALGCLTSGGSAATLTAIVTARYARDLSLVNIPNSVIYLTRQAHHCAQKALRIAGMEDIRLHYIEEDEAFRMVPEALASAIEEDLAAGLSPFMVIGSAGTTNTGTIDPLADIGKVAEAHNLWYHIDAAYGGFYTLVSSFRDKLKGIEMADSIVIDPHKTLFLPYGSGAVLVKDTQAMAKAHHYTANYMQDALDSGEPSSADLSLELSRHFRGLRMWLPLKLFGLAPFRAALEEKVHLARYAYREVQALGFETGPPPDIAIFIFRYVPEGVDPNIFNRRLAEWIRQDGRVFVSTTTLEGVFWIRLAISCFRTHLDAVDRFLTAIREGVESVRVNAQ